MDKYQKLIMQHAYYSDLIRELKRKSAYEFSQCLGVDNSNGKLGDEPFQYMQEYQSNPNDRVNCIENAIDCHKDAITEASEFGGHIEFERVWEELIEEELVCKHCVEVRRLKQERMKAIAHLGAIRGAMTKMGRKLAEEAE